MIKRLICMLIGHKCQLRPNAPYRKDCLRCKCRFVNVYGSWHKMMEVVKDESE